MIYTKAKNSGLVTTTNFVVVKVIVKRHSILGDIYFYGFIKAQTLEQVELLWVLPYNFMIVFR